MPRRGGVKPRKIEQDPVYKNMLITKLINRSMKDGKKSVAQRQVYKALDMIKEKSGKDPIEVFSKAMGNIRPTMEVRPRRVGGAAYQVPMPVRGDRKDALAIRWLIFSARARSSSEFRTYADKLSAEIMDAANGEGAAVKKRADVEKMAEANKAFAHFKW
ncbi:30S ribosomal protein S7 [Candidatus Woesebacteria bacterium]|nr:30S ribosomal protein S7 [Candidatus Woesebacteria bacterium]